MNSESLNPSGLDASLLGQKKTYGHGRAADGGEFMRAFGYPDIGPDVAPGPRKTAKERKSRHKKMMIGFGYNHGPAPKSRKRRGGARGC